MKTPRIIPEKQALIICLPLAAAIIMGAQKSNFPKLTGPYLGQKPPGMTPEIFAPGIVSNEGFVVFKGSFSPDGNEYYFYKHALPEIPPELFFTRVENGIWTEPVPLAVAQGTRTAHPCVSHDNQWLFFTWTFARDRNQPSGYYAAKRTDDGWSAPRYAGPGMYLTSDNSGRLYTTESVWGDHPKHYISLVTFENGRFTRYDRQSIHPHHENQVHPCIAPDGSYILFDINVENGGLYVSFKDDDDNWGEAIDLSRHGIKPDSRGAYISPDGKYLFFNHGESLWWVSTMLIDKLRPEKASAAGLVKKALEERGPASAKAEIIWIVHNRDRYAFDEKDSTALGNEYLKAGKPHLAAAVFEVAVDVFPGSISALGLLAHSRYQSGDEAGSLEVQARMMAVRGNAALTEFLGQNNDSLAKTAEQVIARSIEATGGRKAWEAVKTMVVAFSMQSTSGEQRRMIRMYKSPLFYRQGLEGSDSFTSTDGTTCWAVNGGQWKEIENAYLPLASMNQWLLGYEDFGVSYRFMGFDFINGSPVYLVRRTFRNGGGQDLYFSAVTNLLTEIRSDYVQHRPFMRSFQSFWNYRDVNGVKIPFVFIRNLGSLEPPHGGVVEEVRINEPLDDTLFLPPGRIK